MAKQTTPIDKQCQHRSQCCRDATYGLYRWEPGDTDVDLDKPLKVYCGQHKPRHRHSQSFRRNVKLLRSTTHV